jgi:hypothetical protein
VDYSFGIVPTPKQLAADISRMLPNVKSGSLRFWGEWFGRPFDNGHLVVSCDATDDCLRIHFNQGEVLAVWNLVEVKIDAKQFRIGSATALRWTWYYYGRSQTPENLFYMDYAKQKDDVVYRTNWNQVPSSGTLDSAAKFPAVEMF